MGSHYLFVSQNVLQWKSIYHGSRKRKAKSPNLWWTKHSCDTRVSMGKALGQMDWEIQKEKWRSNDTIYLITKLCRLQFWQRQLFVELNIAAKTRYNFLYNSNLAFNPLYLDHSHFIPLFSFCTSWKHQKTYVSLGVEKDQCLDMG